MKKSLSVAALVLLAAISSVSCDKFRPPMPELQKPSATTGQPNPQEDERSAFAQAAQKELDELKVTIAEFKAKAEASGTETKDRLAEEVKKLDIFANNQMVGVLKHGISCASLSTWPKWWRCLTPCAGVRWHRAKRKRVWLP